MTTFVGAGRGLARDDQNQGRPHKALQHPNEQNQIFNTTTWRSVQAQAQASDLA